MNPLFDRAFGFAASKIGDVTNASWFGYRLLFAPGLIGTTRGWISRRRASAAFYHARRTVPAYQEFLARHGATDPRRLEEIPPMDKHNYIAQWPIEMLCQGGRLPMRDAVIDESSARAGRRQTGCAGRRSARRRGA